jgi:hypothetical protein
MYKESENQSYIRVKNIKIRYFEIRFPSVDHIVIFPDCKLMKHSFSYIKMNASGLSKAGINLN